MREEVMADTLEPCKEFIERDRTIRAMVVPAYNVLNVHVEVVLCGPSI